jgi:hypothetical protein
VTTSDQITILKCPTCASVDVDFDRRSHSLVRCSFCRTFVNVTAMDHLPARDQSEPSLEILRGHGYAPMPPRHHGRSRVRLRAA